METFVTGGAGFIGSQLTERLLAAGHAVTVYDNFSSGREEYLAAQKDNPALRVARGDVLDLDALVRAMDPAPAAVFHLSANPEARWGLEQTDLDLKQETIATFNVLEAMRRRGARQILFASSGTVYGEVDRPVAEDHGPIFPISLYGAGKAASEALISAFVGTFGFQAWIFRFGNVVGSRMTHGVIVDFLAKLEKDRSRLEILGDGRQHKPYLLADDVVAAILFAWAKAAEPLNCFNLAPADTCSVRRIAELLLAELGLADAELVFGGGDRGWPGDVPVSLMDASRAAALGWRPSVDSESAVRQAVRRAVAERWGKAAPR